MSNHLLHPEVNLDRGPQIISTVSGSENEEDTVEATEVEERLGLVSYGTIQCLLTKGCCIH